MQHNPYYKYMQQCQVFCCLKFLFLHESSHKLYKWDKTRRFFPRNLFIMNNKSKGFFFLWWKSFSFIHFSPAYTSERWWRFGLLCTINMMIRSRRHQIWILICILIDVESEDFCQFTFCEIIKSTATIFCSQIKVIMNRRRLLSN